MAVETGLPRARGGTIGYGAPSSAETDQLQRRPMRSVLAYLQATQCRAIPVHYLSGRLNVVSPQNALMFSRPRLDVGISLQNPLGNMQPANRISGLQAVSTPVAGRYKVSGNISGGIVG